MNFEDIKLSISFPSGPVDGPLKIVSHTISWKHKKLFEVRLNPEEFMLGLSSLQLRPVIEFDFNLETLKEFVEEASKMPIAEISITDTSTQREKRYSIVAFSECRKTIWTRQEKKMTKSTIKRLKEEFPLARLRYNADILGWEET